MKWVLLEDKKHECLGLIKTYKFLMWTVFLEGLNGLSVLIKEGLDLEEPLEDEKEFQKNDDNSIFNCRRIDRRV